MKLFKRRTYSLPRRGVLQDESGQGMTEYILILGLIAIASVGAIWAFGTHIERAWEYAITAFSNPDEDTDMATGEEATEQRWENTSD